MSESKRPEPDAVRVVGAIGREFERVIERDAETPRRPYLAPPVRRIAIACLAALVGFGLLTTPGRDAAAWVGGLVGIGEVGGPPTKKKRGMQDLGSSKSPVVIDNGRAPDGTPYEWVAYRCKFDWAKQGSPGPPLRGIGLTLEWPTVRREGGGTCSGPREKGERIPVITLNGGQIVPSQEKVVKPDVVFSGTVGAEAARRVRVVYQDPSGKPQDLHVDFARVDGRLRQQAGSGAPAGTFVAFLDGERAARHRLPACLGIQLSGSPRGVNQRRRCDEIYPKLRAFRLKIKKCREQARPGDVERVSNCAGRLPHPLKAIAYDADGRKLGQIAQPMALLPALTAPPPRGMPRYRGRGAQKRGRRPADPNAQRPVILISSRTPDGVPYEYFAQKAERKSGKVYSVCLTLWFPYAKEAGGSGHCGPGFPSTSQYPKRWPKGAMVRTVGFLKDGEPATAYLSLQGFAQPGVARVRVVYKDGKKGTRVAEVRFVRVRGRLRQSVGSREPFGFFTAFLRPSVRRYYNGPGGRAKGPPAIEVIAYDGAGRIVDRFKHRN